ncbi:MAG: LapA family protein [Rhodocyclaceae bacterium]|jgi:uncharacterized integral membrane protein|nr:LapA family protein [Rhodocyclaceae bacterium]
MQLIVLLSIVVAIGGVSFALQNQMTVTVSFLLRRFDSSLAMAILVSLALGACVVLLAALRKPAARQLQDENLPASSTGPIPGLPG